MKRISFICAKGLETFIDPIANALDKSDNYLSDRCYVETNKGGEFTQQVIARAVNWADIVWFEWANETTIIGTNFQLCPDLKDKKVIVRLHSYEALTNMPSQINWEAVNVLVYVAPHIRRINDTYNQACNKLESVVIPNGIDMAKYRFRTKQINPYNIAWVGYINYKKNPAMMLQIMQRLVTRDKRYVLHIAGTSQDPRYEVYLRHMINAMGLAENILFHGWVNDMNRWYRDKFILLSTSIHEGHPYCIMEAMAKGIIPVIHNFYGAEDLYHSALLFNTVDGAVHLIETASGLERVWLREHVKARGWTLSDQVLRVKELINGLG